MCVIYRFTFPFCNHFDDAKAFPCWSSPCTDGRHILPLPTDENCCPVCARDGELRDELDIESNPVEWYSPVEDIEVTGVQNAGMAKVVKVDRIGLLEATMEQLALRREARPERRMSYNSLSDIDSVTSQWRAELNAPPQFSQQQEDETTSQAEDDGNNSDAVASFRSSTNSLRGDAQPHIPQPHEFTPVPAPAQAHPPAFDPFHNPNPPVGHLVANPVWPAWRSTYANSPAYNIYPAANTMPYGPYTAQYMNYQAVTQTPAGGRYSWAYSVGFNQAEREQVAGDAPAAPGGGTAVPDTAADGSDQAAAAASGSIPGGSRLTASAAPFLPGFGLPAQDADGTYRYGEATRGEE